MADQVKAAMENTQETAPAKKVRVLVDAKVTAEFDLHWVDRRKVVEGGRIRDKTPEEMAVMLEEKCQKFHEFVRDHRSQDPVLLTVERVYRMQCSACNEQWELYVEDGIECCANCGIEVVHD